MYIQKKGIKNTQLPDKIYHLAQKISFKSIKQQKILYFILMDMNCYFILPEFLNRYEQIVKLLLTRSLKLKIHLFGIKYTG